MNRRKFILGFGTLGALGLGVGSVVGAKFWPEQGFTNPCLAGLPENLARHELVQTAWEGIDPAQVWDSHTHLIGTGDSASGVWINPNMDSLLHPIQYAQKLFFLNASCVRNEPGQVDDSYLKRMLELVEGMRPGVRLLLFAFDYHYTAEGRISLELSNFHTPNDYAMKMAQQYPAHFRWAASIHPYRADCVTALEDAVKNGALAVKWLPAAMGIDPASPRCDKFYEALARLDVPLITHAGEERAVHGGDFQAMGNPLLLRRALDHGVRVVVAHCASMGEDHDIDQGENGPWRESFELFSRLMDEPRYVGRLFGDISAMTQLNRVGPSLIKTIERTDWHARLLNGSDYPLPGVMPLFSVDYMAEQGYIEHSAAPVLSEIRKHNPLLFDFLLKRRLRAGGKRFATSVFETRKFFERKTA